jgi:glutaredoxin-related protein
MSFSDKAAYELDAVSKLLSFHKSSFSNQTLSDDIIQKLIKPRIVEETTISNSEMKERAEHFRSSLIHAESARSMCIKSTEDYNFHLENSVCHDIGHKPNSKSLGLPTDSDVDNFSISSVDSCNLRTSENEFRSKACHRSITQIYELFKCPKSCAYHGECKNLFSASNMVKEIKFFWGDEAAPLSTSERRSKIIQKLLTSYHRTAQSAVEFLFTVGDIDSVRVCESAYLNLIGHPKSNLWSRSKDKIIEQMKNGSYSDISCLKVDAIEKAMKQKKDVSEVKSRAKYEHCFNFINWYGEKFGSTCPIDEHVVVLPFETLAQLYVEYKFQCGQENVRPASDETFRQALNALRKNGTHRFMRGKGSFPTCDICNNANDLLAGSQVSKLSAKVRDMIVQMKVLTF